MKIRRNVLLTPGPATTSDRVKQAQVVPDICPREAELGALQDSIRRRLVQVVHGEDTHTAVLFAGSGTAAVEACISSVVPNDGKILVLINGAYGKRMLDMCCIHLRPEQIAVYETAYDELPDTLEVDRILSTNPSITHLALIHHETTTGILNPLEDITAISQRHDVKVIVDAMSSFAGIPLDLRQTSCDFVISSSNKCIQGMAGASFVICRNTLLIPLENYRPRSLYLDLYGQHAGFESTLQMRFTPPVQVLYALDAALDEFFEETQLGRYRRYCQCWEILLDGMDKLGFAMAVPQLPQSKLLTTFLEPQHPRYDFDAMHDALLAEGYTLYPGKVGNIASFRLANIGHIDIQDIQAFLVAMKRYLAANEIVLPLFKTINN
ncbi:MAG: 2-aminoethylphosphonate aminotransferase [Methylobacter sp.]